MKVKKETLTKGLAVAHQLVTKALDSPDAMQFFTKLTNRGAVQKRLAALAERWEKSLPDLRTGNPDRAIERECCMRELRLALEGEALTTTKEETA